LGGEGHQSAVFGQQLLLAFDVLRVQGNASHRAHLDALGFIEVTDAFGASVGVDLVNLFAQKNRLVGTFGLADIAVDALLGDHECHGEMIA
jgi:hypothetical protein